MACILAAVAVGGTLVSCSKTSIPSAPGPALGSIVLSESFEESPDSLASLYAQVSYAPNWGLMTITDSAAHTGKQSLTSDSNCVGIKGTIGMEVEDSTVGLQFYLMAKRPEEINLNAGLAQLGSAGNGLFAFVAMGIDKSDSFTCLYQQQPYNGNSGTGVIQKNVVPLGFNKWYKCNIEFNYTNDTATYFLNGAVVYKVNFGGLGGISELFAMRDSLGSQGPKDYYLDDITVYQK
jgi:hypothetical protein